MLEVEGVGVVEPTGLQADLLTVSSPSPRPPGTRLTFRRAQNPEPLVEGKVVNVSVKTDEPPTWALTVKLFSPTRKVRQLLVELVQA